MAKKDSSITPVPSADENQIVAQPAMSAQSEAERQTAKPNRAGRFILRLLFNLVLLGLVAAAIYFVAPIIYQRYVRPVEQNTTQLSELQLRIAQSEIKIADLEAQLAALEAGQTTQGDSLQTLDARLQILESANAEYSATLVELTYQSDLLKAMELLSRARLFLYQSNFGLAEQDVQAARDTLADLQPRAPASEADGITEALFRLDLVLKNLPDFPVAASYDLDIAWQVLLAGLPVLAEPTATPAPTLVPTLAPGDTPAPTLEATSTPAPPATP